MKKCDLEFLLNEVIDIADGRTDPYAKDDEKLMRIRDLCAQAVNRKEIIPGAFIMPTFKKKKRLTKKNKIAIENLLHWRDMLTDRWGDDLTSLLMHEFGGNRYEGQRDIPSEHQEALKIFQTLDENEQYRIIEMFAGTHPGT